MGVSNSKFFRRKLTPPIGMFCSLCYVKSALISIILLIISINLEGRSFSDLWDGTDIFLYIINIVFYLLVANYFRRGKEDFGYAYIGMFVLTLSTYIIPFVFNVIELYILLLAGTAATYWFLQLAGVILGAILGIAYFVLMLQERKTQKKTYNIAMIVIGALISLIALWTMIVSIYIDVVTSATTIIGIITTCINVYSAFILFLFSFLYLLYAYDVYRIRTGKVY